MRSHFLYDYKIRKREKKCVVVKYGTQFCFSVCFSSWTTPLAPPQKRMGRCLFTEEPPWERQTKTSFAPPQTGGRLRNVTTALVVGTMLRFLIWFFSFLFFSIFVYHFHVFFPTITMQLVCLIEPKKKKCIFGYSAYSKQNLLIVETIEIRKLIYYYFTIYGIWKSKIIVESKFFAYLFSLCSKYCGK